MSKEDTTRVSARGFRLRDHRNGKLLVSVSLGVTTVKYPVVASDGTAVSMKVSRFDKRNLTGKLELKHHGDSAVNLKEYHGFLSRNHLLKLGNIVPL